ncbi:MAG TPA: HAD-IC family P-type ATPase [Azospirillum sp.]
MHATAHRPPEQTRPQERQPTAWHAHSPAEATAVLDSPDAGLSAAEVEARRRRFGPNRLTPPKRRPPLMRLLAQFNDVLIHVLLAAGALTLLLGHWTDSAVIAGVVVINALIGFIQEGKAEQALESIRSMLAPHATVLREGRHATIPAEELVPGDRVALASGDRVPADLRIVHAKGLRIQEAALTGESVPVGKEPHPVPAEAGLADRTSMAYSGTMVAQGQGHGVVVATGDTTEIGRIGTLLAAVETLTTPLLRQMAAFGKVLSVVIVGLALATFAYGTLVMGEPWPDMVLAAVGLAVAAIPEGLPAVMTITLAIGVTRMARRNAIIRRLPAVETLGSVGVICSDKTGTLTRNELTVQTVATADATYTVTGIGYAPEGGFVRDGQAAAADGDAVLLDLARVCLLCNDGDLHRDAAGDWQVTGDPTDGALLTLAAKAGLDLAVERQRLPRRDVIPFESEHQMMAALNRRPEDGGLITVKGAPERILARCATVLTAGGPAPVDAAAWHARVEALAADGQRVLAIAMRPLDADGPDSLAMEDVEGLTLLGLCGLIDPPREEAVAAVHACRAAGIAVKMITGDHAVTARAIGRRFGLGERALTGADLDRLDDDALVTTAQEADVFARTTPEHKLRLVRALQAAGHTVSMTGDGVNDAPALKRADVGVAMGRMGTEAAREAADMVLADDNFASIAHAVEEGRTVYDNLRKTILFMLPTNGAQALVIMIAVMLGMQLPITPVQILWVNMVTAVTLGLALAFEPPEPGVMRRPPRDPAEPILPWYLVMRTAVVMALLVAASFAFFFRHLAANGDLAEARTVAVNALVVGEIFYLLNARGVLTSVLSLRGIFGSRPVWVSIGCMIVLQLAFTYLPLLQTLFGTVGIAAADWAAMAGAGLLIFLVMEGEKAVARRWVRKA